MRSVDIPRGTWKALDDEDAEQARYLQAWRRGERHPHDTALVLLMGAPAVTAVVALAAALLHG